MTEVSERGELGPQVAQGADASPSPVEAETSRWPEWVFPIVAFLAVAAAVWTVALLAASFLPHQAGDPAAAGYGSNRLVDTWVHWDGSWYDRIARHGYWYTPGQQSPVAFWPSYPLVLRAGGLVVDNIYLVGIAVTFISGFVAAVLFHRWCRLRFSLAAANTALVMLLLYPFAWYLFGPVYADAFCLAAAIGAFLALERDKLWLAGLAGLLASAARPVGVIVAFALVIRLIEMRRRSGTPLSARDLPVFGAFAGVGAYCTYLWMNWGNPLLFAEVQSAPGWDQGEGPGTWFKVWLWNHLMHNPLSSFAWYQIAQGALAIGVLVLLPRIVRRLGWAYAFLTFGAVMLPVVGTKDFQGTGRYLLILFPAFAVLGELLAERPKVRAAVLSVSAFCLLFLTAQFARGAYVA